MTCEIQTLRKEVWFTPNMNSGRKWSCVWDFGGVSGQMDMHIWLQQKVILVQAMRTCGKVGYRCL